MQFPMVPEGLGSAGELVGTLTGLFKGSNRVNVGSPPFFYQTSGSTTYLLNNCPVSCRVQEAPGGF